MSKKVAPVDPWNRYLGGLEAWDACRRDFKINLIGPVVVNLCSRVIPEGIVEEVHRRFPNRFVRIEFEQRDLPIVPSNLGPYYHEGDALVTQVMWMFES